MTAPIRVLIADDEPLITAGIRTVLESAKDLEVVAVAENGHVAVDLALKHRVDVLLIDINMPVLDGLAALEQLRRNASQIRVVMLTAFGQEPNVLRALRGDAAGFVLKSCAPDELIRAVRAAHTGDAYLSPAVARMVMGWVTPDGADRRRDAELRLSRLTTSESDVLNLVAEGLSNAEVGRRMHMTESTIKTYVSRILAKLNCTNRVQAALLVRDGPLR